LQNKIRTQQQKKNQKESDVHQRYEHKPAEVIINCTLEFHERGSFKSSVCPRLLKTKN
jgi:hypothetical protein